MTKLEEIRKRLEAATPGEWDIEREELGVHFSDHDQQHAMPCRIGPIEVEFVYSGDAKVIENDTAFVSHAPADIDYLLRVVRELTNLIHEVDGSCGENLAEAMERAEVQR